MTERVFTYLREKKSKNILLISFEDADIIFGLRREFPHASIDVWTKEHFVGTSALTLARQLRLKRYDTLVISNRNSTVRRNEFSLRLLALLVKTPSVVLVFSSVRFQIVSRFSLAVAMFPRIVIGAILGSFVLTRAWGSILWWENRPISRKVSTQDRVGRALTIAYLRTDLSGTIKAGGSLSHMMGFVDAVREIGHEVFFLSDSEIAGSAERNIAMNVIPASPLLDFFDELQLLEYHYRVVKNARRIFAQTPPDVIYHRHSVFNFSSAVLGRMYNIPVVLEANYSEVWAKKNWSRLVFERLAKAFERTAFRHADIIVVISERAREDIIPLGATPEKILVNPNGVDSRRFSTTIDGTSIRKQFMHSSKGGILVGFIGTFTRWHGVETLLEASKSVLKENPEIHFLLIGDGNLKHKLELDVKTSGLDNAISFTGVVPHSEAPAYLAACDILVSPHLGFEDGTPFFGSPTKLFEYMAMGKPIIASDLEQIGEVINDNVNGLLMQPGDAEGLAQKILLLANNPNLRRALGAQARRDAEEKYTWRRNAQRVLEAVSHISRNESP